MNIMQCLACRLGMTGRFGKKPLRPKKVNKFTRRRNKNKTFNRVLGYPPKKKIQNPKKQIKDTYQHLRCANSTPKLEGLSFPKVKFAKISSTRPAKKLNTNINFTTNLPWEPTTFIFRGYNPYIGGWKPSFFMVLGSKGRWCFQFFFVFTPIYLGKIEDSHFDYSNILSDGWGWFNHQTQKLTHIPRSDYKGKVTVIHFYTSWGPGSDNERVVFFDLKKTSCQRPRIDWSQPIESNNLNQIEYG